MSAKSVIPKFDTVFVRHGIPKVVQTDNGPLFNVETLIRLEKSIGLRHRKKQPYGQEQMD